MHSMEKPLQFPENQVERDTENEKKIFKQKKHIKTLKTLKSGFDWM